MIKYNNSNINEWDFGTSNIIKVYRNGAVCYYKVTSGDTPTPVQEPCFAVVDDISQYSDTEFEDVFNKANEKWYKLNNLNNYEEYGVYGSGRTITTYDGKLTIDDGYEYQYSGGSWVNVGEVSGSSKTSDFKIGDIKERVTTSVSDGDYLLFSYYRRSDISKPENIMSYDPSNNYLSNLSGYGITTIESTTIIDPSIWLLESTASANTFYIKSIKNNLYWGYQSKVSTRSLNLVDSSSSQKTPVLITPSCKENCYGFVEKKSNASTGYGGYGLNQLNGYTYQLNWWNDGSSNNPCTFFSTDGNADFIIYKMNASGGQPIYPIYYDEIQDPPNNLSFSSMTEAEEYECPYVGMKATIDGDSYVFSGDSISGYEWVYIPGFHGKWLATYTGGTTVSAECDSSSSIGYIYPSDYMTSIEIGDCVTEILEYVFSFCEYLTAVTIGSGITFIGGNAFAYCSSLTSITIKATTPPTLDWDVFYDTNNCLFYVPAESVSAYKTASGWSDYSSRIFAIP